MKKNSLQELSTKFKSLITITLLAFIYSNTISATVFTCDTTAEIRDAMEIANPGDEIIILPGVYEPGGKVRDAIDKFVRFTSDRSGTATNPIILRGSSSTDRPLLQCPDNDIYDGAVISITGNYWELRDIRVAQGSKGIMLDTANFCTLFNVDVQDVGEEAIHIRSGSSDNIIDSCTVSNTGVEKPGFGEGIYIGSDRGQHDTYDPNCNRNIVQNCILGPNIRAEHFDIKEGTEYNIVRNCVMDGTGITGENFSDSFLDIKGIYTSVYSNRMNINGNSDINSFVDFNNRTNSNYDYKTGEKNEIFNNTLDTGALTSIPTATSRGPVSDEIHVYNNIRIPESPWIKSGNTATATDDYEFRPDWSPEPPVPALSAEEFEIANFTIYPNPTSDKIHINNLNVSTVQFLIFDLNGRIVTPNTELIDGIIDVSLISKGTYVLQLSSNNKTSSSLFVKN